MLPSLTGLVRIAPNAPAAPHTTRTRHRGPGGPYPHAPLRARGTLHSRAPPSPPRPRHVSTAVSTRCDRKSENRYAMRLKPRTAGCFVRKVGTVHQDPPPLSEPESCRVLIPLGFLRRLSGTDDAGGVDDREDLE
eukprot:6992769-Pyramimonas_sp.AAC.1